MFAKVFGKKSIVIYCIIQGGQKTWNNLEFDKLGKIKTLEFYREIMEKPGTFFKFEFFNNFFIINKCI